MTFFWQLLKFSSSGERYMQYLELIAYAFKYFFFILDCLEQLDVTVRVLQFLDTYMHLKS